MTMRHIEWVQYTGSGTADKYNTETSTVVASNRYVINNCDERNKATTFLLKTNSVGKYWIVTFHANRTHECQTLTEAEALDIWATFESCSRVADSPSPDMKAFRTVFPEYTITDV